MSDRIGFVRVSVDVIIEKAERKLSCYAELQIAALDRAKKRVEENNRWFVENGWLPKFLRPKLMNEAEIAKAALQDETYIWSCDSRNFEETLCREALMLCRASADGFVSLSPAYIKVLKDY